MVNPFVTEETQPASLPAGLLGTVVAVQANFYQVRLDLTTAVEKSQWGETHPLLLCTRRTRLKKIGQKVMVGDQVLIEEIDLADGRGAIAQVLPRKTELQRPPVANAEQIVLVFALEEPSLDPWQLSRFLVKAESTSLEICLCLNKADLITPHQQQQWQERLQQWGYEPVLISVAKNTGLEQLLKRLKGKISILAGPSGVGKSSLINKLIPDVEQRVNQVSGKLQRGRHTTRHVELFQLPLGGLLADTPGFNQPDLDCDPTELAFYFPEAKKRLENAHCQFNDCLHRDEPNCLVRGDWERYEYYLKFLEEVIAFTETVKQLPDQESNLKLKIKDSGQEQYEPKLESKKYRRDSRRKKHQSLHQKFENQSLEEIEAYNVEDDW
ncbi:small ribosomal subunit biogenesis GTPase RsgA [Gloeothece verrucosa]|uniref:Small ribosomal subunit biogenesis GTPase RsgA n=1 Tax=Gloeothece verrucosa (strain PCC 7822) TaxID=497965 RepID=E0UI31_GLOV7|nr:small ribosomal subunit biogenesis GTPase RsgA [Gloeothece verrucosa]ADN15683.1 ribosome small subunit-dependent GTPase A [Gloeothece verrucosa PCC 7822]